MKSTFDENVIQCYKSTIPLDLRFFVAIPLRMKVLSGCCFFFFTLIYFSLLKTFFLLLFFFFFLWGGGGAGPPLIMLKDLHVLYAFTQTATAGPIM